METNEKKNFEKTNNFIVIGNIYGMERSINLFKDTLSTAFIMKHGLIYC
jgi:hypothetical protein